MTCWPLGGQDGRRCATRSHLFLLLRPISRIDACLSVAISHNDNTYLEVKGEVICWRSCCFLMQHLMFWLLSRTKNSNHDMITHVCVCAGAKAQASTKDFPALFSVHNKYGVSTTCVSTVCVSPSILDLNHILFLWGEMCSFSHLMNSSRFGCACSLVCKVHLNHVSPCKNRIRIKSEHGIWRLKEDSSTL